MVEEKEDNQSQNSRRGFLKKTAAAGLTALTAGTALSGDKLLAEENETAKKAILMDNSLCIECQACRVACQNEYEIDVEYSFIKFVSREKGEYPEVEYRLRRDSCMHCPNSPCIDACPVDALSEGRGQFTVIDAEECIACGRCLEVCPFEVPEIGEERMYKCDACQHRLAEGKEPACVNTCISYALQFGDFEDMLEAGQERVEEIKDKYPEAELYADYDYGLLLILTDTPSELNLV